jgi:hypothetical protein
MTADATARVAHGKLGGPIVGTTCNPAGLTVVRYPHSRVYKCLVATGSNLPGEGKDRFAVGYEFVATIYTKTRRLAWCKTNPQPGEQTHGGLARVKLSPECAGVLAELI